MEPLLWVAQCWDPSLWGLFGVMNRGENEPLLNTY
jgi:hypothetical protein